MKTRISIIATALTLLTSTCSLAAPHSASGIILTYDLDGNEKLSLEEFVDARRQRFAKTDTNHNGTIEEDAANISHQKVTSMASDSYLDKAEATQRLSHQVAEEERHNVGVRVGLGKCKVHLTFGGWF